MHAGVFVFQAHSLRLVENVIYQHKRISLAQFRVLAFLHNSIPGQRVSDIARALNVRNSSVSETAQELVVAGYVERADLTDDRRIVLLSLTSAGHGLVDEINQCIAQALGEFTAPFFDQALIDNGTLSKDDAEEFRNVIEGRSRFASEPTEVVETYALREQYLKRFLGKRMSVNAFYALLTIREAEGLMTPGDIAAYLHLGKSTISATISELLTKRLVTTHRCEEDRRRIELFTTAAGRTFIRKSSHVFDEMFALGQQVEPWEKNNIFRLADFYCKALG